MQAAVTLFFIAYMFCLGVGFIHTNFKIRSLMKKIFLNSNPAVLEKVRKIFPNNKFKQIHKIEEISDGRVAADIQTFHQMNRRNVLILRLYIGAAVVFGLLDFFGFYE